MSEIHKSEIIYEEGWREAPVTQIEETAVDEAQPPEKKADDKPSKPLLICIQLAVCLMAAFALFIMKAMDSGAYHDFMDSYREELDKPVVSQGVFDALDAGRLFGGSAVSAEATPDEAEAR